MASRYQYLLPDRIQRRLGRIGDPVLMATDPCLNCTLPFDCDETAKGCRYIEETGRQPLASIEPVRLADLTNEDRVARIRQQKRDSMRRARSQAKASAQG